MQQTNVINRVRIA